jgi:hypothetical protein
MPHARHLLPVLALLLAACGAGGGGDEATTLTGGELGDALAVEYPCGLGFAVASEDQRFALILHHRGSGDVPDGQVSLPDPEWRAEVLVGTDLMANWCDDVIESGEPTAEVSETWPVVGGELTYDAPDELPQGCSGEGVTAEVTDLTVETAAGEQFVIPDRTITNEAYGCFAG